MSKCRELFISVAKSNDSVKHIICLEMYGIMMCFLFGNKTHMCNFIMFFISIFQVQNYIAENLSPPADKATLNFTFLYQFLVVVLHRSKKEVHFSVLDGFICVQAKIVSI